MSARRWLTLFVGLALWCVGFWLFLDDRYVLGGVLVLAGGFCCVVAASAGWSEFVEGVTNWLFFWR